MGKQSIRKPMLVTGGAGYIGSHCVVALLEAACEVLIADSLSNIHTEEVDRIERKVGRRPAFERIDLRDALAVHQPYLTQAAAGRLPELRVFGGDFPTPYGNAVRDYIHGVDPVSAHLAALQWLERSGDAALTANLGTGRGYSVLEMVRAFERVTGREVPHRVVDRRPGDVAVLFADPGLANRRLGWSARLSLEDMCRDAWNWQRSSSRA